MKIQTLLGMPVKQVRHWIDQQHPTLRVPQGTAWYWRPRRAGVGCVVAHIDTVWDRERRRDARIYYDPRARVLWSPSGLGADDRAGVAMAVRLRRLTGCAVLLCDQEEVGGKGAKAACSNIEMRRALRQFDCIIGLDRQGVGEFVCYNGEPPAFRKWLRSFGLHDAWGTFSDTLVLAEALERPCANISTGFFNEHTHAEYLDLTIWHAMMRIVARILTTPVPTTWHDWRPTPPLQLRSYHEARQSPDYFGMSVIGGHNDSPRGGDL